MIGLFLARLFGQAQVFSNLDDGMAPCIAAKAAVEPDFKGALANVARAAAEFERDRGFSAYLAVAATDAPMAHMAVWGGPLAVHQNFPFTEWLKAREEYAYFSKNPIVMRITTRRGTVEMTKEPGYVLRKRIISGGDPMSYEVGPIIATIAHIHPSPRSSVTLHVTTSSPFTKPAAKEFAALFSQDTSCRDVTVYERGDSVFSGSTTYPIRNPFTHENEKIPSESEYRQRRGYLWFFRFE